MITEKHTVAGYRRVQRGDPVGHLSDLPEAQRPRAGAGGQPLAGVQPGHNRLAGRPSTRPG